MHDTLSAILAEAGTQALGFFNTLQARTIEAKAPGDLVSDADRAIEVSLRRLLARHFPDDGILGEEMGGRPSGRFWAVDPIDGTSNFLSGLPFWTISVGLMDRGQPIAGGILAPALGLMAVTDGTAIHETGLAPGSRSTDPPCIGLGRNDRWPAADRHALEAAIEAQGLSPRLFGSCALSLMLVATHRLKGYIEPRVGGLWDCAAGLAICRAAGLPTAFKVHPDGTVDVLAGQVFDLNLPSDWARTLAPHRAD
ncbi:inositol monophosphatase family protein [Rhodobacter sp. SY28-1]|uniref:inositol monophosphatase family protein n=1 Tax=Rhodobacter sp. SY28-1 TaxID=2562317 RepID=UPI0010C004C1|nr:inositol monophosphatase family protein [Rhodobacter sp. SY28-1]